jgi:predicted MFS family arabinose efflux permease
MDAAGTGASETAEPSYWKEILANWRLLAVGVVGLGFGFASAPYVYSLMGPRLLEEFNWPRAEFAAVNGLMLIVVLMFPFFGRVSDLLGVKRTAAIGVIAMPAAWFAFSMVQGSMAAYMTIFLLQAAFGITTTAIVFTRLIVHHFKRARGLALAIVASGPALFGAFAAPALNEYVEVEGWRAGYIAIGIITAVFGAAALFFLPSSKGASAPPLTRMGNTKKDYGEIFRNKAFWILVGAIFLCNMPTVIGLTQLLVMLEESGISPGHASSMLAAHAVGTLVGRFGCGLALDRWPMHIVSAIALGSPAIGLALIASPIDAPTAMLFSVLLIGLANGAEADLVGYVVAAKFGTRVYSSVMGLTSLTMGITSAVGAILLGATLAATGNFNTFLMIVTGTTTAGALLLLTLKRTKPHTEEPQATA